MGDTLVRALLAIWFGVTVLVQFGRAARIRSWLGPFGYFVPDWRFFTSPLAWRDLRLAYRVGGGDWNEATPQDHRRWWHVMWHPRKRVTKALFDATSAIVEMRRAGRRHLVREAGLLNPVIAVVSPRVNGPGSAAVRLSLSDPLGLSRADLVLFEEEEVCPRGPS